MTAEVDDFSDDGEVEYEMPRRGERGSEFDRILDSESAGGRVEEGIDIGNNGNNELPQLRGAGRDAIDYNNSNEGQEMIVNMNEDENEEEDEDEDEDEDMSVNHGSLPRIDLSQLHLPSPPPFEPVSHPALPHSRKIAIPPEAFSAGQCLETMDGIPRELGAAGEERPEGMLAGGSSQQEREALGAVGQEQLGVGWDTPGRFFQLFFTNSTLEVIKQNTNHYAYMKGAGEPGHRRWKDMTIAELKIFLGLVIYMGVFKSARVGDYWRNDGVFPQHNIARFMGHVRFEQLKRYFHLSPPTPTPLPRTRWTEKLEPLSSNLQAKFQQLCRPATPVSIDEMMIRFTGRSEHISLIKSKPTPEGFKIIALCEKGYTFSFLYTSRTQSFTGLTYPSHFLEPIQSGK